MDSSLRERALLPVGLHDLLPPEAEREAALVERAMGAFGAHGYERVKPPLIEFEESLVLGMGQPWARQTFRLLDPESKRMMGVRADMTLQVARIASSRLANAPRPLRLCYAGEVLRVGGGKLSSSRQLRQIGCELIGSLDAAADAEIVLLASHALDALGVQGLSIDLNLPTMVPAIFAAHGVSGETETRLAASLARRDAAAVATEPGLGKLLASLLEVAGPAARAIEKLSTLDLPASAEPDRARLIETVRRIREAEPALVLTVDPVERQGFEYQTGLSFTIFAKGVRRELGRGGRYRIGAGDSGPGEPAVGFSLLADSIVAAAPQASPAPRVYIPAGRSVQDARRLRETGWVTVVGLVAVADEAAEARRLGCGYLLRPGPEEPQPLD
ncbi:MAG TPA: ATP phosphoribosyltransferase regulatory subunit [Alphaproteobacteria bacterium]|nr:ATP phosphoribosyltransferase regulatory subunit [Alphaproteobacteria bacterium]